MKLPFLPNHPQFARVKFSLRASALFAAIIALIFVALLNQAHAQLTWNDPANKQWSNNVATWNNDNWWADPNSLLVFASSGSGNVTNNMADWGNNYNGIIFNSGAASFNISGNSIGLTNVNSTTPKIENNSANTQTVSLNNIALRNVAEFNPSGGNLVISSANIYMDSDLRVWGNGGHTLDLNTLLSQGGSLGIQQNSTVLFRQVNTYTGQTFIHGGQLVISNGARAGTGNINLGGTNLGGASLTNALYLGTASSGGGVTNTNQININAGGGASTIGANNTSGVNSYTGPIVLGKNVNIDNGGGTLSINGVISGTGFGITKQGAGVLILSNANTYTGTTTVSGGTLRLGAANRIADDSALSVASGATFDLNNFFESLGAISGAGSISIGAGRLTTSVGAASSFSGTISGTGNLVKNGTSTLTLSGNNSSFSGAVFVSEGAVRVSDAGALGDTTGTTSVSSGAALELTASPGAEVIFLNGTGISSGGALRNISGNNTLSRGITLADASRINSDLGTLTVDVSFGNAIIGTANLTIGGAGNVTIADNVAISTGTMTKDGAGILTLSGANTYTGATTVTNGTLVVNGSIAGSTVSVGNATTDNGSVLMGSGSVGATTININGRISPGNSVGTLSVSNTLTFGNGADYLWEINGTNGPAGTTWDLITVDTATTGDSGGTLALGSSGQVTVTGDAIDGFTFNGGLDYTNNFFRIIGASTVTGNVSVLSFNNVDLGSGSWTFATNASGLFLNYTAPGVSLLFTNSAALDQGAAGLVTNNSAGAFAQITNQVSTTAVIISNTAPVTFTNANNNYTGATVVASGTLVTTVDSANNSAGAFGNAVSTVQVGSTNGATSDAANLLIGAGGVTVGRGVAINVGSSGTRTVGATNVSGVATYSGNISAGTNVTLSASNSGGTTLFSGAVGGAGAVSIAGNGQVVLSGDNTGLTNTISIGNLSTLVASNNTALGGGSAATTVNSGGALALAGGISTAENVTIAGTGISSAGALRNVSGNNTNTGTITLSGNATISADTGTALELNNISLAGANNRSVTVTGAGNTTIKGNVSTFAGSLTNNIIKDGTGNLIVDNNGTSGTGQLNVINGSVTIAGGSLTTSTNTGVRAVDLGTGPGGDSANNVAFYANTGVTVSNSFYVAPNTSSALRTVGSESSSGTITYNNQFYLGGNIRLTSAGTANVVFSGNITNDSTHSVTKIGAGTVTLSGGNTYVGTAVVEEGTLALSGGSALANTVGVAVNGGTLAVNTTETIGALSGSGGNIALTAGLVTSNNATATSYAGTFTGTSSLSKNGTSTLTLSGNSTGYSGEVILNNGGLLAGNAGAFGTGTVTINFNDGTGTRSLASSSGTGFTLNKNFNLYYNAFTLGQTTGGTGSLTLGGIGKTFFLGEDGVENVRVVTVNGSHAIAGQITGGANNRLAVAGGGTLTLSGANTFSGGSQLREGTILVGDAAALGTGTLQIQFDQTGTRTLASSSSASYTLANNVNIFNSLTLGQTSGGTGSLTLSGATSLGDPVGEVNSRTVTVNGSHTLGGVVSGGNGLVKAGNGTLTLSGASANTYTGLTTVSAGTLNLNKSSGNAIAGATTISSGAVLLLSASNQVDSGAGDTITLSGGTITRGSGGVSEAFGNLNITAASFLDFGTGATASGDYGLRFETYTNTGSALVTVNNFLPGNKLQFLATSFNAGSLSAFSFDNGYTTSTSGGYFTITAIPEPSTYVAAAGLLALFLWPVRRRLIKDAKSILGLRPSGRDRIESYRA